MLCNLKLAEKFYERLSDGDRKNLLGNIDEIRKIKYLIEEKARELGYSKACKESVSLCGGMCCKWHFPTVLSPADFLVAICGQPINRRIGLLEQLSSFSGSKDQCPLLCVNGCFLSFETRPVSCTTAYPCHAGQIYWEFKEEKKGRLTELFNNLNNNFI